jgi:hypothetical protein
LSLPVAIPIFLSIGAFACSDGDQTPDERFISEWRSIAHEYTEDVLLPVADVQRDARLDCSVIDPAGQRPDECTELVDTLRRVQSSADQTLLDYRELAHTALALPSPRANDVQILITWIEEQKEIDRALISAWDNYDSDQWSQAWQRQADPARSEPLLSITVPPEQDY